ncbi:unnamed protein product [Anisakis simplex]|uniref:Uncharacterized protein n=1 Tax=Anisakis simplex TaxID=6269 RepID=A0A0M3JDW5_ANISI|nr:unnamed protein product [Anisakis simplex]
MLQLSVNSLATLIILSQYAAITIRLCVVTRSDDAGTKLSPVAKKVLNMHDY